MGYGGLGVVIHPRSTIGAGTNIGTCVTIGGRSGKVGVPAIGKNCIIGSGAKILGPVVIGDNCSVGANAVVLKDVPANHIAVGIPAEMKSK